MQGLKNFAVDRDILDIELDSGLSINPYAVNQLSLDTDCYAVV